MRSAWHESAVLSPIRPPPHVGCRPETWQISQAISHDRRYHRCDSQPFCSRPSPVRRRRPAIRCWRASAQKGWNTRRSAPVFDMLTVNIGPRLTASPAHKRAAEWARDRLASYGLDQRASRAVEVRARLDAREAHGRDGGAALPAAASATRTAGRASTTGEIVAAPVFHRRQDLARGSRRDARRSSRARSS